MEIKDKTIGDEKFAVINYKGPISNREILLSKLFDWVEAENIDVAGNPFIIYYSQRAKVNEGDAVYDVGIPINEDAEPNALIKVVDMFEHNVLSAVHKGSYENILDTYEKMVEIAENNNYDIIGSPKEVFIKSLLDVDNDDDLITEIQLPIIKM